MTRNKKAIWTSSISLLNQVVTIVCGFILPRYFLANYGSNVNGLVSSITHFLGFITLAECGVGAVVRAAFYKPLAEKDDVELSKIVLSSERFFRRIAVILLAYTAVLVVVYPSLTIYSFDRFYTASMIVVIAITSFAQYFFGMTYRLMLASDQRGYIAFAIQTISTVLNAVLCILLMKLGAGVHIVKFVSSMIFIAQPLILSYIGNHQYHIDRTIVLQGEPIKQKWNGLAQHIASVILSNTDTVVLTLFSTLENVSIYAVYYLVVNGVKQLVDAMTNGIQSLFGNMIAKNEIEQLNRYFGMFEWIMHTVTVVVFAITANLIVPFVSVYTKGINDANYILPTFGLLMVLAQGTYCLRLPYSIIIVSAGHFKQTQASAILEALINVISSIICVFRFGLIGVAVGTVAAMTYRTIYYAWYLSKNIMCRPFRFFAEHCFVDFVMFLLIILSGKLWSSQVTNYYEWILLAIKTGIVAVIIGILVNSLFYWKDMKNAGTYLQKKIHKL